MDKLLSLNTNKIARILWSILEGNISFAAAPSIPVLFEGAEV